MAKPLDLDLLTTFVAVVETGSFSSAAPRIGRSQSAVSMQIQRLEQIFGKQLLVRTPKAVIPTAVGLELLTHARQLLKLLKPPGQASHSRKNRDVFVSEFRMTMPLSCCHPYWLDLRPSIRW